MSFKCFACPHVVLKISCFGEKHYDRCGQQRPQVIRPLTISLYSVDYIDEEKGSDETL